MRRRQGTPTAPPVASLPLAACMFLDELQQAKPLLHHRQICELSGVTPSAVVAWSDRHPDFRQKLEVALTCAADPVIAREMLILDADNPTLPDWQLEFCARWAVSQDRVESARAVGKSWKQIEQIAERDTFFSEAIENVTAELMVQVEDQMMRSALDADAKGGASAKAKILEAYHPRYAAKTRGAPRRQNGAPQNNSTASRPMLAAADAPEDASGAWRAIFERTRPSNRLPGADALLLNDDPSGVTAGP